MTERTVGSEPSNQYAGGLIRRVRFAECGHG